MDRAPRKLPNTSSRLIAMAASIIGNAETVRVHMGSSAEDFALYQAGKKEPTSAEFGRLLDLIIAQQSEQIRRNRDLIAAVRKHLSR